MKDLDIGYEFRNPELKQQAFRHSSYANECGMLSNERLEFLGDSVLNMLVSDYLFNEKSSAGAGELTQNRSKITKNEVLAKVGEKFFCEMKLGRSIDGKNQCSDIKKIKADLVEAILGAIWQDSRDLGECLKFLNKYFDFEGLLAENNDFKTLLQHYSQKDGGGLPEYDTTKEQDENGKFYSKVFLKGVLCGEGCGSKKQDAERAAAKEALTELNQ